MNNKIIIIAVILKSLIVFGQNTQQLSSEKSTDEAFFKLKKTWDSTRKKNTVKNLNVLFDNDKSNQEAVLIVSNKTKCNLILEIEGIIQSYKMPVAANESENITIKKGKYRLKTNICNAKYNTEKNILETQEIVLKTK